MILATAAAASAIPADSNVAVAAQQFQPEDACRAEIVDLVQEATGMEVVETQRSVGLSTVDDVRGTSKGCAFEAADGRRYTVRQFLENAVAYWDALLERREPPPGWMEGLAESDLEERADELVIEDDELILRADGSAWYFGFGTFGDDPTEADRRRVAQLAGEIVGDPELDRESVCGAMKTVLDRLSGVAHQVRGPIPGQGSTRDDTPFEWTLCRLEPEASGLQIHAGVGDPATFESRRPSGTRAPPRPIESDVGDGAVAWAGDLLVRAGEAVFILGGRTADGDLSPQALLPLAQAVVTFVE